MLRFQCVGTFVEPKRRNMLLFRSFVGTVGISIQFYAMSKMVLTDAVVITFTSPIITFLLVSFVELDAEQNQWMLRREPC